MSSDDTWKGKPNASEYTHTQTYSKLKFNLKIFLKKASTVINTYLSLTAVVSFLSF